VPKTARVCIVNLRGGGRTGLGAGGADPLAFMSMVCRLEGRPETIAGPAPIGKRGPCGGLSPGSDSSRRTASLRMPQRVLCRPPRFDGFDDIEVDVGFAA